MKRRDFIANSTMLGAAALIMPKELLIEKGVILGHNNKRYKLDKTWSRADASKYPVNNCHEMVQDKKGRILLLTDDSSNNVIIYNKRGKVLDTWGHEYPGAHGLTLFNENGTDVLFICDNKRHQVIKTSITGKVLLTLNYPKETGQYSKEDEFVPTETAIAANGDIYVADGYGKDFIIQYDYKGKYIRHFGGRGTENKHLLNAHGVCIDNRSGSPKLVVTSRQQYAFKYYDMEGNYLETVSLPGAWVCRPVIKDDYLYAAVLRTNSQTKYPSGFVCILNKENKNVSNISGIAPLVDGDAQKELLQEQRIFDYPHDVCIDDEGCLYVAQWNSGKVYPYKLSPVQ